MKKNFRLTSPLSLAAATLFLLPAAALCAQNAPAATTAAGAAPAQSTPSEEAAQDSQRAQAYYHSALAGMYEDDAVSEGRTDEINQAIEQYKLALNDDPGSAELSDELADLYFRVGRIHDAEVTARNLLKTQPNDIDAHRLLGRIYLRQLGEGGNGGVSSTSSSGNALDEAIAEFETIVSLQPRNVENRMVLGQLYTVKHESDKAEAEFKSAQAIEPDSEDVVLNLARVYAESGNVQQAVKVIEAVPEGARTSKMEFTLGAAYDQLKDSKDAIAA